MIVLSNPFKTDKFFAYAEKTLIFFSVIYFFFLIAVFFYGSGKKQDVALSVTLSNPSKASKMYEKIGTGPLSLNEGQLSKFLHGIRKEIVVLAVNTRPGKSDILLGTKTGEEEKILSPGKRVYLEQKEEGYRFSERPTPISLTPVSVNSSVMLEVSGQEEGRFYPQVQPAGLDLEREPFQTMKLAVWTGTDQFVREYGGEEYKQFGMRQKVLFPGFACYVEAGEYLAWKEGNWTLVSSPLKEGPLARIEAIHSNEMEIIAWDEEGFHSFRYKIPKVEPSFPSTRIEEVMTAMRLRTASQVSCVIGKKRMLIKPGDWIIKTKSGWHKLRRASEIDDFLQHKLQGELFVFDSLEKEQGKMVIKGRFFDERRTQMTNVNLPFTEEKKGKPKKRASFDKKK